MILSAHQAHYLPWLGYLDKIDRADIFVFLDDVQYEKNGWQNRNRIRTPRGWQWLTVPVHAHLSDRLLEVQVMEKEWQKNHSKSLKSSYGKAPHFSRLWDLLETLYEKEWRLLAELNWAFLEVLLRAFGIAQKRLVRSSSLHITTHATQRLVDLCKAFHADSYFSGDGAKAYLDLALFEKAGIQVTFQNFSHPVYPQLHQKGGNFIEGLSCMDLLFNCGEESLEVLRKARRA